MAADDAPVEILATPKDVADYFSSRFWDDFYEDEREPFEWYHPYAMVRGIIRQWAGEEDKIIILGCGNSRMAEDMVEDGYKSIVNIDFSRVVIEQMKTKYEDITVLGDGVDFYQLDVIDMSVDPIANEFKRGIPDHTYDVALDKACLDCVLTADDGAKRMRKALHEIDRILKPDGVYIVMSHNSPDVMMPFLDSTDDPSDIDDFYSWEVQGHQIGKPTIDRNKVIDLFDPRNTYFLYVCVKDEDRCAAKAKYKVDLERAKKKAEEKAKRDRMKKQGRI